MKDSYDRMQWLSLQGALDFQMGTLLYFPGDPVVKAPHSQFRSFEFD